MPALLAVAASLAGLAAPDALAGTPSLTGIYATRAAFAAAHGPPLGHPQGVAYGPRLRNGGTHIAQVGYSGGRVTSFTLEYETSVAFDHADQEVIADLPEDARPVFDARKSGCEMAEYYSPTIAKLVPATPETPAQKRIDQILGRRMPGLVLVAYYSSGHTYQPGAITSVILAPGYNLQDKSSPC